MGERLASASGWVLSALLHGGLLLGLSALHPRPPPRAEAVSVEILEAPRAAPPRPPAPRPASAPARAVASPRPAPPPGAPLAPAPRAPIRIGVSLSGTAVTGGVAAPAGDSLRGVAPPVAPDPAQVAARPAGPFAPATEVAALPALVGCDVPPAEYPARARAAGFEGDVRLRLVVDESGRVTEARVLSDPGQALGEAAPEIARRHCRFRPARRADGSAVGTEIPFTLRFVLP